MTMTPATHAISVDPTTGETLAMMPWASADDIENALTLAARGFEEWKRTTVAYRAQKLRDIGQALRNHTDEMAHSISRDGKTDPAGARRGGEICGAL